MVEQIIHEDPGQEPWDAVVIGTGMGGAVLGHRLTEIGLRILFLEKGSEVQGPFDSRKYGSDDPVERASVAHWPHRYTAVVDGSKSRIHVAAGCAVGGSTRLYSAALERLERHDVEPTAEMPHPTGGWPIRYDALTPYYDAAERLFRVRGTAVPGASDNMPLDRPPPMREIDAVLMQDLAAAGLRPYRMHVGIAYKPGCAECLGSPCPLRCKSDTRICAIEPAIAAGATLMTNADVKRLDTDGSSVTGVVYESAGELHRVRGSMVILAAGTLSSAPLLLASRSTSWPRGLANGSGLVGRNLMFHADDWVAIWPSRKASPIGPAKTIASRALYVADGARLGLIHSTGLSAGYGNVLMFLYGWFDQSWLRALRPLRAFLRIPAKIAEKLFGSATILSILTEDLPYADNRLELDPDSPSGVAIHYRWHDELHARTARSRKLFAKALTRSRMFWLRAGAALNWGHPMGTCRFGTDPATSVLDPDCKAHEVDNLYVVDASFMPSGGGVNPSLTIAANALRVADVIAARFGRGAASSAEARQP